MDLSCTLAHTVQIHNELSDIYKNTIDIRMQQTISNLETAQGKRTSMM